MPLRNLKHLPKVCCPLWREYGIWILNLRHANACKLNHNMQMRPQQELSPHFCSFAPSYVLFCCCCCLLLYIVLASLILKAYLCFVNNEFTVEFMAKFRHTHTHTHTHCTWQIWNLSFNVEDKSRSVWEIQAGRRRQVQRLAVPLALSKSCQSNLPWGHMRGQRQQRWLTMCLSGPL